MHHKAADWVSLQGEIIPVTSAAISPHDRGLLLGDGAFETVRVIDGCPYLLAAHMARMAETLKAVSLPFQIASLASYCEEFIHYLGLEQGMLRITVTRGSGGEGYLPLSHPQPVCLITARSLDVAALSYSAVRLGISRWRKIPPACLPVSGKTLQGLNATLARMEAQEAGYDEMLQLSLKGYVACASSGNLFWRKDGRVYTPALTTGCLAGVTRQRLMQLSEAVVEEVELTLDHVAKADAVIITNSRLLVCPVRSIESLPQSFPESDSWAKMWRLKFENDAKSDAGQYRA
jgi:branched-subunit amino acid aminotransferase/4-amino-4-deoxychorismate lyase